MIHRHDNARTLDVADGDVRGSIFFSRSVILVLLELAGVRAVPGAGAYSEGLDTSTLLPGYRGVGILRGATDASPAVRTYLADGQDTEKILTAACRLREQAGTLSSMAAGLGVTEDDRDVLADVLQVFGGEAGLHWPVLAERLNTGLPARWADTTGEAVSAECRARGVPSVQVKQFGQNRQGCRRADVEAARAGLP
jgi:S-DNA-T family DNA segregation ATPase FtsK/SpoIIIE